jgi:hypothetical protein
MLQAINTWSDYRAKVREFDAVLEYGKAMAGALGGAAAPSGPAGYGQQIFVKLLSHCIVLRGLAAEANQRTPGELWDVPSMAAVARSAVEAHDAFEYIAGHDVTPSERSFRIQLWELHDTTRRLRMFNDIGSTDPRIADIRADAERLQAALEGHEFLASLHADLQAVLRQRLAKGDPPAFHLNQRQRCMLSGVQVGWHNIVTMQLSQYAHTLPSSTQQLSHLQPGSPEALQVMALPLVLALPFLARVIHAVDRLMLGRAPEPPSRTARTMALWRALAEGDGA